MIVILSWQKSRFTLKVRYVESGSTSKQQIISVQLSPKLQENGPFMSGKDVAKVIGHPVNSENTFDVSFL